MAAGSSAPRPVTLFLCGDVMTGRGIDQILAHPSDPALHEPYVRSAREYLDIAERATGPIPRQVDASYVWGEALAELNRADPDARILNLETSVTVSNDFDPKGINYRMHPANAEVLKAIGAGCCVLANNHVMDFGRAGLKETLATLHAASLKTAGAGATLAEAARPAVLETKAGPRVLVFAAGTSDSGIPPQWAATGRNPGVAMVDLSRRSLDRISKSVREVKRAGDIVVFSIHWGGNWGYEILRSQREFAHALLNEAGVDVVHGHSSHHPKGIEVHNGKLILYGCGDFLNDYEGIMGEEAYRGNLTLMYFARIGRDGRLMSLEMVPLQIKSFRLQHAAESDAVWLQGTLDRESRKLGPRVELTGDHRLSLRS